MIYNDDCLNILPQLDSESIDLLLTDPPYGIKFMSKSWDKALPDKRIWAECLRVLKPGSFAFVMSIPRSDCQARMVIALQDVGFRVDFTPIYWAYASGFPKAQNIAKMVDKRLGVEREVTGTKVGQPGYCDKPSENNGGSVLSGRADGTLNQAEKECAITVAISPQAKALDGSYGGFQPKPAVEVIIVAMKPLSEKTFVDQALKNRKGITWLDDGRIPTDRDNERQYDKETATGKTQSKEINSFGFIGIRKDGWLNQGRFPANLLVSEDVLNDGRVTKSTGGSGERSMGALGDSVYGQYTKVHGDHAGGLGDSGSFSRYFDLDKWAQKTFPFLIVPKASKAEKNKGLDGEKRVKHTDSGDDHVINEICPYHHITLCECGWRSKPVANYHPTVKPLKLMSYLITLGSREGDVVLDPFLGSGTTALACQLLNRECIGIELEEKYCEIARQRCSQKVLV